LARLGASPTADSELVLASSSPQRRELLASLGVKFTVCKPEVDEATDGIPARVVVENALRKSRAVAGELVLGADTAVCVGDQLLGKPGDACEAKRFLRCLSGRCHEVYGGLALRQSGRESFDFAITRVCFRALTEAELAFYVATGEWRQRAGGYAIQGKGALLVEGIDGDYSNVVGLPLSQLVRMAPAIFGLDQCADN
jgi:septum formation protein